ncbi:thiamine phosphate synthase [Blastomonas sp.]|uniref:thiamine phosphate synthase n=1 Tax=Blastomonas sp. TaxID=1909299 RepID=UPI003918BD89
MPTLWLISDARNDAVLERAIARMPLGSGLVFRHYHLDPRARRARFDRLAKLMRIRGGVIVLAGDTAQARRWRADGCYGAPVGGAGYGLIRLLTVHDAKELLRANLRSAVLRRTPEPRSQIARHSPLDSGFGRKTDTGSTLALISPVFPTRSHPGDKTLGAARFAALARLSRLPVIPLGGMTRRRARQIAATINGWAAIDGLSASQAVSGCKRQA